jgi:hypothetical protein
MTDKMSERETLARLLYDGDWNSLPAGAQGWWIKEADRISAAGWMKRPEPGSAEEDAMAHAANATYYAEMAKGRHAFAAMCAALRAALATDTGERT